ncbi:MAG TPA: glycoside hydrolase family 44 protein [Tepidisphaeraceae bacterium]|nr:glycoside hydrolase family 44 protein [Tepidisphaeraceae bacterium]
MKPIAPRLRWTILLLLAMTTAALGQASDGVHFVIDAQDSVRPISRYIYGVNSCDQILDGDPAFARITFTRLGGNRMTCYNWVNNASNAGNDWHYQSDDFLVSEPRFKGLEDVPGEANVPLIEAAARDRAATLLTIPINGYVAADKKGDGDVRASGPNYLSTRFRRELPKKNGPFTLTPDPNAPFVYQDEFVNWVKTRFPYGESDPSRPIWFDMDNEPGIWEATHAEVHAENPTYAEMITRTIAYASAAKEVMPRTLIFGPASYGWGGFIRLQNAPDADGRDFQVFYLQQMALAEKVYGRRLLDVMDVHWYPEAILNGVRVTEENASPEIAALRMQIPRSLWDADYVEPSWVTRDSLHGAAIRLIPRLMEKIDSSYPGTKLAFTEYYYGGGSHISGGIAEADVLGIFGRSNVFAAAIWPLAKMPFIMGAMQMYRNFDGQGAAFGDTSIHAATDDTVASSVYASLDSGEANRMVIVAINKTDHSLPADIRLSHFAAVSKAVAYQLTSAAARPEAGGNVDINTTGDGLLYIMPPYSVTTIQLTGG